MTPSFGNMPLRKFRKLLEAVGCKQIRVKGGHEIWSRSDLPRPITLQTHISPVPEMVIRSNLRTLGLSREEAL